MISSGKSHGPSSRVARSARAAVLGLAVPVACAPNPNFYADGSSSSTAGPGSTADASGTAGTAAATTGTTGDPPIECEQPTLALDFADGLLDPRFLYFRDEGVATHIDQDGFIRLAEQRQPRFDHDPSCQPPCPLGLLLEPARTNSLPTDLSTWSQGRVDLVGSDAIAPDGAPSAQELFDNLEAGEHAITWFQGNYFDGEIWTFSIFAKAGSLDEIGLIHSIVPGHVVARFSLTTGQVLGTGGEGEVIAALAQPSFDDWWRVWLTFRPAAGTDLDLRIATSKANTTAYPGAGESILIWGPQLERGELPTSLIPTGLAPPKSRAEDIAEVTELDWFQGDAGTFVVDFSRTVPVLGDERLMELHDPTATESIGIRAVGENLFAVVLRSDGEEQGRVEFPMVAGQRRRVALAYASDGWATSIDGGPITHRLAVRLPQGLSRLDLGGTTPQTRKLIGNVASLRYYPCRRQDTELRQLSMP